MKIPSIPFNNPHLTGKELPYIAQALTHGGLAEDGPFTSRCHSWLEKELTVKKALLTHSCSAALEMAALLADIQPGDEIIMPSYTFVSTANAFVLRGGVPVFVDIRPDTLNLDETLIEAAITAKTKAIVPVHYGGAACEMDTIMALAEKHNLLVIEDAAQAILAEYKGRALGSIGHIGCLSFHETKNIISGQGGALLINDERFIHRAEVLRDVGTNRKAFLEGRLDRYSWCDLGSSYRMGEAGAAFLWAQLEEARRITQQRLALWDTYHQALEEMEKAALLTRPVIPENCRPNAHMYYILANSAGERKAVLRQMQELGVQTAFHYVPLHQTDAGRRFARVSGELPKTRDLPERLIRLPLWIGADTGRVIQALSQTFARDSRRLP